MSRTHTWEFPLPRTHTGVLLGNGTLGAIVWGAGPELRITLGRADHWDHRGGMPDGRRPLSGNPRLPEREGSRARCSSRSRARLRRPTVLPVGRVVHLSEGPPQSATLEMRGELG